MSPIPPSARLAAVLCAVAVLLAGCGAGSSSSPTSSTSSASSTSTSAGATAAITSGHVNVSISAYAFHPATVTVKPGSKIIFSNHDQTAHTATSTKTAFDTGTVKPGASATVTLSTPGTYTYYCQFHAFMHGTIVVK